MRLKCAVFFFYEAISNIDIVITNWIAFSSVSFNSLRFNWPHQIVAVIYILNIFSILNEIPDEFFFSFKSCNVRCIDTTISHIFKDEEIDLHAMPYQFRWNALNSLFGDLRESVYDAKAISYGIRPSSINWENTSETAHREYTHFEWHIRQASNRVLCDRRRNAPWVCLKRNQHWNFACGLSTVCRRFDLMTRRLEVQLEFRAVA